MPGQICIACAFSIGLWVVCSLQFPFRYLAKHDDVLLFPNRYMAPYVFVNNAFQIQRAHHIHEIELRYQSQQPLAQIFDLSLPAFDIDPLNTGF